MAQMTHKPLFGGSRAWISEEWISIDDRVRGGSSHSTFSCSPQSLIAEFYGKLDISTLGGAGFASQRTTKEIGPWDVSEYDGLEVTINRDFDGKIFTIIMKDDTLSEWPGEREQTTNWEYDFRAVSTKVLAKWDEFRPTRRGKPVENAKPLDLGKIKSFSIMVRSFFGEQQGDFSLQIASIAAFRTDHYMDNPYNEDGSISNEKSGTLETRGPTGWLRWLMGGVCC